MIFKRKEHKLPKFPPDIIPMFEGLCVDVSDEQVEDLLLEYRQKSAARLEEKKNDPVFDKRLAKEIQSRCEELLTLYPELNTTQKRLVIGAVRYCAASGDAFSDDIFASGLRDDVKVLNYVIEELGVGITFIELDE